MRLSTFLPWLRRRPSEQLPPPQQLPFDQAVAPIPPVKPDLAAAALRAGALMVPTLPLKMWGGGQPDADHEAEAAAAQLYYYLLATQPHTVGGAAGPQLKDHAVPDVAGSSESAPPAGNNPRRRHALSAAVGICIGGVALGLQRQRQRRRGRAAAGPAAGTDRWTLPTLAAAAVGFGVVALVPRVSPPKSHAAAQLAGAGA